MFTNKNASQSMTWASVCFSALILVHAITARAETDIVIGLSLPQQGADLDGRAFKIAAGTAAAINSVNAAGGIGGRKLKLVTLNNEGDPAKQERNIRSLVRDHKVSAILNCVGDQMCRVSAETVDKLKVPLIGMFAGTATIQHASHPYAFRIRVGYQREADAMAKQLRSLGNQRIALVSDASAEQEAVTALRKAIEATGLTLTAFQLDPRQPTSAAQIIEQIGKGGFGSVVLELSAAGASALIANEGDQRSEWPTFIATLSGSTRSMLMGSFPARAIGFTAVAPDPEKSNTRIVRELMKDDGGSFSASNDGIEGYINAKVLVEALRRTKGVADGQKLASVLGTIDNLDLGGYRLEFGNNKDNASDYIEINVRPRFNR